MSSGGNGRNDVEFSIGADNAPLESDLKDTDKVFDDFVKESLKELEKLGESIDNLGDGAGDNFGNGMKAGIDKAKGALIGFKDSADKALAGIGDSVKKWSEFGFTVAENAKQIVEIYDQVIASQEEALGLNRELREAEVFRKEFEKGRKERQETALKSGDIETLENQIASLKSNLFGSGGIADGLEGQLRRAREAEEKVQAEVDKFAYNFPLTTFVRGGKFPKMEEAEKETLKIKSEYEALRDRLSAAESALEKISGVEPVAMAGETIEKNGNDQLDQQKAIAQNTAATAEALKNLKTGMKP